ncbi:MAG: hypothetical protein WDN76_00120 [Alphaproteobacteria bacterium]
MTNDVALLLRHPVIYAGLLTPQGYRSPADFFLWRTEDGVMIDAKRARRRTAARQADALQAARESGDRTDRDRAGRVRGRYRPPAPS